MPATGRALLSCAARKSSKACVCPRQIAFRCAMSEPTKTKEERLAEQLRANLRRRKANSRASEARSRDLSKNDGER